MKTTLEFEVKKFYIYSQKHGKKTIRLLTLSLNISSMILGYHLAGISNKKSRIRALFDLLDTVKELSLEYCEGLERRLKKE